MTKGEKRRARKAARAAGQPLTGELAIPSPQPPAVKTPKTRRVVIAT